ncbi:BnaA08g03870D [Brassica napus]|uniref:BnaA08g03870D protein n=1 Tax=Brassica napus TaxID=3708 RepID=A0A078FXF3_BRANA|nr:BnaA08g03870D [Brassica napus]
MPLTVVAAGLSKWLDIYSVLMLDWPFDSGRKKTYLSQERGQRTPKYSDRLWKKVESWCKAVERTFDRILETSWERQQCMWLYACGRFVKTDDFRLIILQEGLYQSCYKKPPMPFFTLFGIEDAENYVVVAFNELKVFARVRSITNQYKRFSFRTKYMLTIHVLQIQVPWIVPFCGLRQRDDETHQKGTPTNPNLIQMSSGEEMELPRCLEELAGNEYVFHLR